MELNKEKNRRWYDKDPILSKAMAALEESDDEIQLKIALNLIKIIIEHNIEDNSFRSVDDILGAVEEGRCEKGNERWYDLNETIRTAVQMLENTPDDIKHSVIKDAAKLIKEKIRNSYEPVIDDMDNSLN